MDDASDGDATVPVLDEGDLQNTGIALQEPGAKLESAEPNEAKPVEGPGPAPDGGYVCSIEFYALKQTVNQTAPLSLGLGDRPFIFLDARVHLR